MANLLKLRLGVSDDPTAFQPSLNDCLDAMLQQADMLVSDMLGGLVAAVSPNSPRRIASFQQPSTKLAIQSLAVNTKQVCATYKRELTRLVYEGGGKEQVNAELLRFEDLRLFEDSELDQSIEVARAQQEVSSAVDDVLPALDALMSTLLGWRTIQPGLNPLRPDVFVRALQSTLAEHVPEDHVREVLIAPAAGLLGTNLRRLYKELAEWLRSSGVEPAVPVGGRINKGSGASGAPVVDSMAKTLLTLDRLRKLLAGDFDANPTGQRDFLHTMPASMSMLQDMKQVDVLVQKLEKRPKAPPPPPVDMLVEAEAPKQAGPRLGHQLGEEVVRLMFDNLSLDKRLLPQFKGQLKSIEPAVLKLAEGDSRFFSDRTHPARQFLDRITQRSLAFSEEKDPGWARFLSTVEDATAWLTSKEVDAETFGELLDHLQEQWTEHDQFVKQRREEAARALLHAEQRNLLAQKLATEFTLQFGELEVPDFVADFLRNSWAQVVAEAQLSCADGSDDPYGYRALVDDLTWSVQRSTATRGRARRLVQMIPGLLAKLREGLDRIDYPPELTARFFNNLIVIHRAAVHEGRDKVSQAAAEAVEAEESDFNQNLAAVNELWLDHQESQDSGFIDSDALTTEHVASPEAVLDEPPALVRTGELRTGTWVELLVKNEWVRAQLTWASPHGTLFMFTSLQGTAHSMSRRTMDRLRTQGAIKIIADRNVIDEALDKVAKAALKNSLKSGPEPK
ncbi:DUF1631 family protein [Caenimonas koreensis]|uniref:DUF1631 family protein n=1 Tax=Caenimonas koreensis DSM 17982 TaxID=1121255 RepID=A0A844AQQ2_9BURK|nr:DUF1631 family protein [Caenimonas koreensis]MRD46515.1 DUF1631 family protein [Caenimonas koreensis DSM 17982]